ncbi:TPA: DNA repair and recombination protein RadB [Candidatus Woesearchaeota archaeon]|nr:DNA repair and recombination protein RadB [Candidatus Woesearchaeota archaeon]
MDIRRVSTGAGVLDGLLSGGYESDTVTTIYGPSGSGKTNICMLAAVFMARKGRKVIYIDTEGGFSAERLKQIAPSDYADLINNIIFLLPTDFDEQRNAFSKLSGLIDDDTGIVIVDTIAMLYRLEMGKTKNVYDVNKDLGLQISYLNEITRKRGIPVLITNQVYASFEDRESIRMVGGDILKYGSKCLISLEKFHDGLRCASIKKHRSIAEDRSVMFKIVNSGIEEINKG